MRLLRVGALVVAAATLTACGLRDGGGTQRQAPARDTAARVVTEKDFDHRNVVVTVSDLVRVDWMGRDEEEVPSLVSLSRLDARAMTEVRREVRRLDSNAYEVTGAYAATPPVEGPLPAR